MSKTCEIGVTVNGTTHRVAVEPTSVPQAGQRRGRRFFGSE